MALDSQQLVVIRIVVKKGFNVQAMIDQYYFALPVNHNTLHHFFWNFNHFTFLPILEGAIIGITNHDYDKYFSIATWGKSDESCDAKEKEKHKKQKKERNIYF